MLDEKTDAFFLLFAQLVFLNYQSLMSWTSYWIWSKYKFYIRFTSPTPNGNGPACDPLLNIRPLIDWVNRKFDEVYRPRQHLSVDEVCKQSYKNHFIIILSDIYFLCLLTKKMLSQKIKIQVQLYVYIAGRLIIVC